MMEMNLHPSRQPFSPSNADTSSRLDGVGQLALCRQASIHDPINQSHSPDDISETMITRLREVAEK
jgi:hypothetical protein